MFKKITYQNVIKGHVGGKDNLTFLRARLFLTVKTKLLVGFMVF